MEKKILMKNNDLIKAKYNLSLTHSNVFIHILYKLQRINDGQGICVISHDEFKSIVQNRNEQSLAKIRKILQHLMNEKIFFKEERDDDVIWGEYNILSGYEYSQIKKEFTIICSPRVYELLTSYMQIGYTPVNLLVFLSLKSIYAQRMYELLRLWSNTKKTISYDVAELRELFMLENKYKNYQDFKRNVLNTSVDMLNETGMFKISYTEKKEGRSIKTIEFNVEDLDDRVYFKKEKEIIKAADPNLIEEVIEGNTVDIVNTDTERKTELIENTPSEQSVNEYGIPTYNWIPDETLLSRGVRVIFLRNFAEWDFKNEKYLQDAFYDAIGRTMDKDNVDVIDMKSYGYFKKTLEERIQYYMDLEVKNLY